MLNPTSKPAFIRLVLFLTLVCLIVPHGNAAEVAAPKAEISALVQKINKKLEAGNGTEKDLAPELKEFDALLEKHAGEKTEDVAFIRIMKVRLYLEVLKDAEKALVELKLVAKDFPDTQAGANAQKIIPSIEQQAAKEKVVRSLVVGATFPEFNETDLDGKPLSVKGAKAKAVLIDFWATWCGPCRAELPNVKAAYNKYHKKGFQIIGINLDEDRDAMVSFLKNQNMPWPQYFDGKGWENKLVGVYGVSSIPATYLLDGNGKIIAKDLRGSDLDQELAKLLGK